MRVSASTTIKRRAAACASGAVVCLRLGAAGRRAHAAETGAGLAELVYELLDAHTDTAQLIDGLRYDPSWAAHLDYLRALQRKGREMLARTAPEALSPCRWDDVESLDVR